MNTKSVIDATKAAATAAAARKGKKPASKANKEAAAAPADSFQKSSKSESHTVTMSYLPQDPGMLPIAHGEIEAPQEGLTNGRFKVSEPSNFPTPKADENGNYNFQTDDPRFDATNAFYVANQALQTAEKYAGRKIEWSFKENLDRDQMLIHPHAGGGTANAFYQAESGSINFFHYQAADGNVQRTAQQFDVVAHETGHAILDAMRPNYLSSLSVASGGFHEAFGDMTAFLTALNDPNVVAALHQQTKGDLSEPNIVSGLAEQLGSSDGDVRADGSPAPLREMINDHKYADQYFLPYYERDKIGGGFGTEAHAYANLFTGAFYDVFQNLYNDAANDANKSFAQSVGEARDQLGKMLFRAVEFSPVGDISYREMALSFIKADLVDFQGEHAPMLAEVFVNRNILSPEDVEGFLNREVTMPELKFTRSLEKAEGAEKFLDKNREALGLPKEAEFKFQKTYTNDAGERFVVYTTTRTAPLDGPDFGIHEGSKAEATGGVLLNFDAAGTLQAATYDPITDREMEDIKNNIKTAIKVGALVEGADVDHSRGKDHQPRLHIQISNSGDGPVIRRAPVIFCGDH